MSNIAIIGCGWVGKPLSYALTEAGHKVLVSSRTKASLGKLTLSGFTAFCCDLSDSSPEETLVSQFVRNNIDLVVGAFPPGFRKGQGEEYAKYWEKLVRAAKQAGISKLVMISSTTVYPGRNDTLTESDASLSIALDNPEFSENAVIMLRAEQAVIDSGLNYVVIRFSGLFGPDRHPARFVNKLKNVSRLAPANMLHLDDAVGVTRFAIDKLSNETINATSPETVSKAEFYQSAIDSYHEALSLPEIVDKKDKRISPEKVCSLGYPFIFKSPLDGLKKC